jgi:hypothetical protein
MKLFASLFLAFSIALGAAVGLSGCSTTGLGSMTSAQGVALGQPIIAGGLALVLENNPKYIPIAQTVGTALSTNSYTDLTTAGVNAAIGAIVTKAGGDAQITSIIEASVDAGLVTYLEAVGESALAKDPNAQAVLQELGAAISQAATTAAANPKN